MVREFKYYWLDHNKLEIDTIRSGQITKIDSNGFLHSSDDKPAFISYHQKDKRIESEFWFKHGYRHRLTGSAYILYNLDGEIALKEYWINGKLLELEVWKLESNRLQMLNKIPND